MTQKPLIFGNMQAIRVTYRDPKLTISYQKVPMGIILVQKLIFTDYISLFWLKSRGNPLKLAIF